MGWIGVDLDGTLAEYHGWVSNTDIGKPIPKMLRRVQNWLQEGREVKIMTARAYPREGHVDAMRAIRAWSVEHLGRELPITYKKDMHMIELWDDRAIQVETNTGERVDGKD